jgi:hypothetical protein
MVAPVAVEWTAPLHAGFTVVVVVLVVVVLVVVVPVAVVPVVVVPVVVPPLEAVVLPPAPPTRAPLEHDKPAMTITETRPKARSCIVAPPWPTAPNPPG